MRFFNWLGTLPPEIAVLIGMQMGAVILAACIFADVIFRVFAA